MAESKLRTLSVDFAVQILNLVKLLKSQHETIISNHIGRAGTSIGANIHEAQIKPDDVGKTLERRSWGWSAFAVALFQLYGFGGICSGDQACQFNG